jgi:hypothetical protein
MINLISDNKLIVIVVILAVIAIIAFLSYYYSVKQIVLRRLSKTPHKSRSGFKPNEFLKVSGKALHVKEPLIAPMSRRKCIFYSIKIEKKVSNGKSSHWKTILKEEKIQEFFIDSNGELIIVRPKENPRNFVSYLVKDHKLSSGFLNDPTPDFESYLRQHNISSTNILGLNKSIRYHEGIVEVGEKITVAGIAKWKNLSEPIPNYPYSRIAELESSEAQKLIITDLPQASVVKYKG